MKFAILLSISFNMKKNYIIFYLCLFFIFIIYIYPIQYKSNIINLVNLFFYFFLPALLPTSFFLNILLKTNIIQNIKNKKVSSFLITFLLAFGGTPLFLVLSKYIDKTKFKGQEYRFVGPSFSFMIYLFQINHNQFSIHLFHTIFSFIISILCLIYHTLFANTLHTISFLSVYRSNRYEQPTKPFGLPTHWIPGSSLPEIPGWHTSNSHRPSPDFFQPLPSSGQLL